MQWYAVTTRPNCEAKAALDLRRADVTVWFPRRNVGVIKYTRGNAKRVWIEKPAFARYLFVKCPADRLWLARKAKCSVVSLDANDTPEAVPYPTAIPDPIMAILMAGFDDTGLALAKVEARQARFKALQQVRYREGHPYRDLLVKVVEDDGTDFIRVLITIFGRENPANVAAEDLEAA